MFDANKLLTIVGVESLEIAGTEKGLPSLFSVDASSVHGRIDSDRRD